LDAIVSTRSGWQPAADDDVNGNTIRHRVPESHAGGLIFDLLPVSGKHKERYPQSNRKPYQDAGEGSKTPGTIIPDHVHCDAVDPSQNDSQQNADEHLVLALVSCCWVASLKRNASLKLNESIPFSS